MDRASRPLGRMISPTDEHIRKYPIRRQIGLAPQIDTPVIAGINWYDDFDRDDAYYDRGTRRWIIGRNANNLGSIRGGHCVCIKPLSLSDTLGWWDFYDQGNEGACVGFGSSRAMSLIERTRFDAIWLYRAAQAVDPWPETPPEEGTNVPSAIDILRTSGHRRVLNGKVYEPTIRYGVATNRWATTVEDVTGCLKVDGPWPYDMVPILNSWGRSYKHIVWMPLDTLARVLREDGEMTCFVPS
jgi:hypothetical protein